MFRVTRQTQAAESNRGQHSQSISGWKRLVVHNVATESRHTGAISATHAKQSLSIGSNARRNKMAGTAREVPDSGYALEVTVALVIVLFGCKSYWRKPLAVPRADSGKIWIRLPSGYHRPEASPVTPRGRIRTIEQGNRQFDQSQDWDVAPPRNQDDAKDSAIHGTAEFFIL